MNYNAVKRRSKSYMMSFILIYGLALMGACQTPPSNSSNPVTSQAIPSPLFTLTPIPSTNLTPSTQPQSSQETLTSADCSLVIFKIVVAGDYEVLRIPLDGPASYVHFNRGYEILEQRSGKLPTDQIAGLVSGMKAGGFFDLPAEVLLPESLQGEGAYNFEDTMYWLDICDGQQNTIVLGHEYALSEEIKHVIEEAFKLVYSLPVVSGSGAVMVAVGLETLSYMRASPDMPRLSLDPSDMSINPQLEQALSHPGMPVSIDDYSQFDQIIQLQPNEHLLEVNWGDEKFLLIIIGTT